MTRIQLVNSEISKIENRYLSQKNLNSNTYKNFQSISNERIRETNAILDSLSHQFYYGLVHKF